MQAKQFGITNGQQQKKVAQPAYRAIDGELFCGRQVYLDSKDCRGYFAAGTNTFVFITPTRYHAIAGELFCGRQTYWSPAGEKGFFDADTNEFHQATAAEQRRLTGKFVQPLHVVRTERRPTGHQLSKGKKGERKAA